MIRLLYYNIDDYDEDFIEFLLKQLKLTVISNLKPKKLVKLVNYIVDNLDPEFDIENYLVTLLSMFTTKIINDKAFIVLDNTAKWNSKYKVTTLYRFLDLGNLSIAGSHMFTKSIEDVKNNMKLYYIYYLENKER